MMARILNPRPVPVPVYVPWPLGDTAPANIHRDGRSFQGSSGKEKTKTRKNVLVLNGVFPGRTDQFYQRKLISGKCGHFRSQADRGILGRTMKSIIRVGHVSGRSGRICIHSTWVRSPSEVQLQVSTSTTKTSSRLFFTSKI
jgi:hypothetical protein